MLKKYLIQLEPSKFAPDVIVVDLIKLREPIIIMGELDNAQNLDLKPENQLDRVLMLRRCYSTIEIDSLSWLCKKEFTIILEKEYVRETTDSVRTK